MKKKIFGLLILAIVPGLLKAGVTSSPSCYSNAKGWRIEKIEQNVYDTKITLSFYTYENNYSFFWDKNTVIENYDSPSLRKLSLRSAEGYNLNEWIYLRPNKYYEFTLVFEPIPKDWKNINIKESSNYKEYNSWHWNFITLNTSDKLRIEHTLTKHGLDFFKTFAHPTNTIKFWRYNIDYSGLSVVLYYNDGNVTDLYLTKRGNIISDLKVVYETDFVPPFFIVDILKETADKDVKNSPVTNNFEQWLGKSFVNMTGKELVMLFLSILLLN